MQSLLQDIRYALRQLRKSPGFTITAVLTLALGIGADTVIFTVAKQVLLDKLAVPHPEQLRLFTITEGRNTAINDMWGDFYPNAAGQMTTSSMSYPVYQQMRRHNQSLQDLFGFKDLGGYDRLTAKVDGNAETVSGELVSGNYYEQLGVSPVLGRAIQPSDDGAPGTGAVAIISDGYWASRFGRSPTVLGKVIEVNFTPVTIIGVNPPGFTGATQTRLSPDVFFPFSMQPVIVPKGKHSLLTDPDLWWMQVMGRLKPGVPEQQAQAALAVQLDQAARATMTIRKGQDTAQLTLADGSRGIGTAARQFAQPVYVLMALVGVVLLLACANIANLLLARSAKRHREMSVRLALGASRTRILRQMFTESMLLSLLGGGAGLLLGYTLRNAIPRLLATSWEPAPIDSGFDLRIFGFTTAITILSGLVFGLVPAWYSSRQADVSTGLKDGAANATRRRKGLAGKSLTVFQIALSLLLVVGAGLFLRTFMNLSETKLGFSPKNILLFSIQPPKARYTPARQARELRQIEEALIATPDVATVGLSSQPLLSNDWSREDFRPEGKTGGGRSEFIAYSNRVSEKFFSTFSIPIVGGRSFNAQDTATSAKVAIVNQALAKKFFPNANPIGKSFQNGDKVTFVIVGISADAKYADLRTDPPPTFYLDYQQQPEIAGGMTFELHTRGDPGSVLTAARRAVQTVDPDLPLIDVRTQTEQISANMQQERIFASLTSGFGILALALACIGIYGVMAYSVAQRTSEIGIRLALGAQSRQVLLMVLREATWMAVIGVAAGLAAALALTRFLTSMLFELKPYDPLTLGGASVLLFSVALLAGWLPAYRASRVEPMQALRTE